MSSFYSKRQITVVFKGPITIEVIKNKHYIKWSCLEDYRALSFLARYHYKLKTHKKRIVHKYIRHLINDSLKMYIKDHS